MADHPEDENHQEERSIEKNRPTLDNLPPEVRAYIMEQAMNVEPNRYAQADAVHTVHALSQTTRNYRAALVDNPSTLGAKFVQFAHNTAAIRSGGAIDAVGGPGKEREADNVIARYGPLPHASAEHVRKTGATRDVFEHGASAPDGLTRHGVTNPEDAAALRRSAATRDVQDHDASAPDAIRRHEVVNPEDADHVRNVGMIRDVLTRGGSASDAIALHEVESPEAQARARAIEVRRSPKAREDRGFDEHPRGGLER